MAEAEKQLRYPPAAGRRVTTFAIETWGRLGAEAESVLQQLAAAARRRDQQRDRLAINRIPKWRALIDATNQRRIARRLLAAFLGTDGRPWRPPPLRRDRVHEAKANRLAPGELLTFPHTAIDPRRLHPRTDDSHGKDLDQDQNRHGTMGTASPGGHQPTAPASTAAPHAPLTTQQAASTTATPRDDSSRHRHSAPIPADHFDSTASPSSPQLRNNGSTPSQTHHGSELPQGLHAVSTHECKPRAGWATRESPPCTDSVICLAGLAGEGPNVCTQEMTDLNNRTLNSADHATNSRRPIAHSREVIDAYASDHCTHPGAEPMGVLSDGAISACTGSRSRSTQRSTESSHTACRGRASTPTTKAGRRAALSPWAPRYHSPKCSPSREPMKNDGHDKRGRSRSPTKDETEAPAGQGDPAPFRTRNSRQPEATNAYGHPNRNSAGERAGRQTTTHIPTPTSL